MNLNYSFLKDQLALEEIRKHKWIESEKQKKEIGFATAAVDWIKKYGDDWRQFRLKSQTDILAERRNHRRFICQIPVQLKIDEKFIASYADDVNLIGFSCVLPQYISKNSEPESIIDFKGQEKAAPKFQFRFKSRALRISKLNNDSSNLFYKVFFIFDEKIKEFLRTYPDVLTSMA